MKVTVVLGDRYREAAGSKELVEELPDGSGVRDLVDRLASKFGDLFKEIANPGEEEWVSRDVIVLVNSSIVRRLSHELRDGDRVLIADLLEISLAGG